MTTADNGEASPLPPARPGAPGSCHWPFKLTTKMPNRPGHETSPQSHPKPPSQPRADVQTSSSSLPVSLSNAQLSDPDQPTPGSTSPFPSPSTPPQPPPPRQPMNPSLCHRGRGQLSLKGVGVSAQGPRPCCRRSSPQGAWACAQAQLSQAVTQEQKTPPLRAPPQTSAPSRGMRGEARQPLAQPLGTGAQVSQDRALPS